MKISELRLFVAANDLAGKVWNPKIRWLVKYSVLVQVITDDGASGIGECWCFDRTPDALVAFLIHDVTPRILGLDAADPDAIAQALLDTTTLSARHGIMASALSGIDIALWDIAARAQNAPLWRQLGGTDPRIAVYASGGLYGRDKGLEQLGSELSGYLEQGFDHVKMKVGALSAHDDAERVRAARQALGNRSRLIIDGVYSYDTRTALAFYEKVSDCGISAFQSPLPAHDIDGMAQLVAHGVPVLALEAEYRPDVFQSLIERKAVAILQFALVACGGISAGRQIVSMATNAGIACSLEVSSTAIAQMAAFHFAAAHRQVVSSEIHMVHQVMFDRFPFAPDALHDGNLTLTDAPGLGIEVPFERLERRA